MTNEEFMYWVEGYLCLSDDISLDGKQVSVIKNHANLVKAVIGSLNEGIALFLSYLDEVIRRNEDIPLDEVKQAAARYFPIFYCNS